MCNPRICQKLADSGNFLLSQFGGNRTLLDQFDTLSEGNKLGLEQNTLCFTSFLGLYTHAPVSIHPKLLCFHKT